MSIAFIFVYLLFDYIIKLRKWVLVGQMTGSGTTFRRLYFASAWNNGTLSETAMQFMGLAISALLLVTAFGIQWENGNTFLVNDPCIIPSYNNLPLLNFDVGAFVEGMTDFGPINHFGLPLVDGLLGSWSAWPLSNPDSNFYLQGEGVGYAISTQCYDSIVVPHQYDGTKFILTQLVQNSNVLHGIVNIYAPKGSMFIPELGDNSLEKDFTQECHFRIGFGEAQSRHSFSSDTWGQIENGFIESITMGNLTVNLRNSQTYHANMFLFHLGPDTWDLSSYYKTVLESVMSTDNIFGQGGRNTNLLSWGTDLNGHYREKLMWKGLAGCLGSLAHFVVMQFDEDHVLKCDYSSDHGEGFIHIESLVLVVIEVFSFILIVVIILYTWRIYLLYRSDDSLNITMNIFTSPIRLAADLSHFGPKLFKKVIYSLKTFEDEVLESVGDKVLIYGITNDSMEQGLPRLALGDKKTVVKLKRALKQRQFQSKSALSVSKSKDKASVDPKVNSVVADYAKSAVSHHRVSISIAGIPGSEEEQEEVPFPGTVLLAKQGPSIPYNDDIQNKSTRLDAFMSKFNKEERNSPKNYVTDRPPVQDDYPPTQRLQVDSIFPDQAVSGAPISHQEASIPPPAPVQSEAKRAALRNKKLYAIEMVQQLEELQQQLGEKSWQEKLTLFFRRLKQRWKENKWGQRVVMLLTSIRVQILSLLSALIIIITFLFLAIKFLIKMPLDSQDAIHGITY